MSKSLAMAAMGVGAILFAIILVGCSDEPSSTPSVAGTAPSPTLTAAPAPASAATPEPASAPEPAATRTAAPTAAPVPVPINTSTPAPTSMQTPAPAGLSVAAYAQVCEAAVSAVTSDMTIAEDEDFTWGDFAELLGSLEGAYDQINPPQEIQEHHDANLRAYEALLAHARNRPSGDSFIEEFLEVALELIGVAFEIGFDTTKTDDEKERLIEEREQEILGEFFGSDFAEAAQNLEEARQALPEETLALLDDSGCYPDIISGEEDQAETVQPAVPAIPTPMAIPTAVPAIPTPETIPTAVPAIPTPMAVPTAVPAIPTPETIPTAVPAIPTPETIPTAVPAIPTPTPSGATSGTSDKDALVALYNSTDGPNWGDNTNWLSDTPIGEWHGVYTDHNGRVIAIELFDNQLSGEVPPELGNLENLEFLGLWNNQLSGEIPSELGNLENLEFLSLEYNQLSGEIPSELGNLKRLVGLELEHNQLSGEIPAELGNLENLEFLELGDNQLSGEIPPELGNLSNLVYLALDDNQLSGCVPEGLDDVDVFADLPPCPPAAGQASPAPTATPAPPPAATPTAAPAVGFRLVRMGVSGLEPDLATSWSINDDGSEWTFDLRNDARFPDGNLVTAADAIASIEAWMEISGSLPDIASHSQPDDFTLIIRFEEPAWDFLEKIAQIEIGSRSQTSAPASTPVPAPADSNREDINLTFACVRDTSRSCEDMEEFADAVRIRTGGQVEIEFSSYDAKGFPREPATILAALRAGAADFEFVELVDSGGSIPISNVIRLWEAFATSEEYATVPDSLVADMIRLVDMSAGDLKVVGANLYSDDHLFSNQPISNLEDIEGLRARIWGDELVGGLLSSWGADTHELPLYLAHEELAAGNLDAAVTCGSCAVNAKLYEVATHIAGPFSGARPQSYLIFNPWVWEDLPEDIQTIIEEEGRSHTQRELAKAGERDAAGLRELISQGMNYTELPPEILDEWRNTLVDSAGVDEEIARILGLTILPDGSVEKAP